MDNSKKSSNFAGFIHVGMKHLIIIGAGGMGRTMYDMARESIGYGSQYDIRGFIDDNVSALDNFANYPPLIAPIQ